MQAEQSLGDDVHVNLVGSAVDGLRMAEQVGPRPKVVSGASGRVADRWAG